MTRNSGRDGRRRRILTDTRLVESAAVDAGTAAPGGAPRYAPPPTSAAFAVARRVLPTGGWSLAGAALLMTSGVACLAAAGCYRTEVAAVLGDRFLPILDASEPRSLQTLASTLLALGAAAIAGVVFGLRRHRSDDLRGAYRWWLAGAGALGFVAVCSSTGLHTAAAGTLAAHAGWSPLPSDAFWWAAPGVLTLGALATRLFFDLKESRLAAASAVGASVTCVVWMAISFGAAPRMAIPDRIAQAAAAQATLAWVIVALLIVTRRIVLQAEGRLAVVSPQAPPVGAARTPAGRRSAAASGKESGGGDAAEGTPPAAAPPAAGRRPSGRPSDPRPAGDGGGRQSAGPNKAKPSEKTAPATDPNATQWVNGSQALADEFSEQGSHSPRKLSKAQRKRLRREKTRQQRAA